MAWGRTKIRSKVSQKTSFFSFCTVLSLLSLSTVAFSTTTLITGLPTISSTTLITTNRPPRATVGFSLLSAALSVLFFFFFCFLCYRPPSLPLSLLSPSPYPLPAVALTPHQQQSIHRRSLSLSYRFSSPSFFLLYHLQPVPTAGLTTTRRPPWSNHYCAW